MIKAPYQKALFIFRRDLRLEDNTGLIFALKQAKEVIPAFIFTPQQIEKNRYRSDACLQFMIESIEDLEEQLKEKKGRLYLFFGEIEKIVERCVEDLKIDLVVFNRDYTPYSLERDRKIEKLCQKRGVSFKSFDDVLLNAPSDVLKADGKPYTIFTPYYRVASEIEVRSLAVCREMNYCTKPIAFAKTRAIFSEILPKRRPQAPGGRKAALEILKKVPERYGVTRDFPAKDGTSHLSAHLKFTTCSIREAYRAYKSQKELLRSFYWRDFFTTIAYFFPHVFEGAFRPVFDRLPWKNDSERFKKWCEGKTGFPIVDAGMRELNETGFMHNRVRMIAASFLIKDLHIDWRLGEKYFAQHLIDYDPALNNGNWQWCASTGCDAQPYFRIFNPWSQQEKFDLKAEYIARWIPELSFLPPERIHKWYLEPPAVGSLYPAPLLDHSKEAKWALEAYRKISSKRGSKRK